MMKYLLHKDLLNKERKQQAVLSLKKAYLCIKLMNRMVKITREKTAGSSKNRVFE